MNLKFSPIPPPDGHHMLQQHPLYAQTLRQMGRQIEGFAIRIGTRDLSYGQLLCRKLPLLGRVALWSGGPGWISGPPDGFQRSAAITEICRALRAKGIRALISNLDAPESEVDFIRAGHIPLIRGQYHADLDLRGDQTTRRAGQHGKWRNRLTRAEAQSLCIAHAPFDIHADQWLLDREAAQRRHRGYHALPEQFTRTWASTAPESSRLFVARHDGRIVAAMLFLLHAPCATYHIGWSDAQGRAKGAHHLVLWKASQWLSEQGYSRLDLGTVDTEVTAGLARFKLGSGARPRQLGATMLWQPWLASALTRLPRQHRMPPQTAKPL